MRAKSKNSIFICQITENSLRVIKYLFHNSKRELTGLEVEALSADIDDKKIVEKLNLSFKRLEYDHNPVIVSLPRNQATCRYLKVPALVPEEIEKIVSLQASRYLPYPANELITAFQIISTDKEGYSHINLIIVHKNTIERYLKIFKELKVSKISVVLSSYGIANLYNYIKPDEQDAVMIIDIDYQQAELAIISSKKILFSRSFKLSRLQPNWENLLIDEINKTQEAYLKAVSQEPPRKIIVVGVGKILQEFPETLNKQVNLPLEVLFYTKRINLSENLFNNILNLEYSFASLIGLGLEETEESLNLLPEDIKIEAKKISQHKGRLRKLLFISVIILLFGLGVAKDLDNKAMYLERLKVELNKIAKEAKPLEDIEKRFKLLEIRAIKKPTSLDILYEIHQIIPREISLVSLNFEEDKLLNLRGQTPELNSVFAFVEQLEKSSVFEDFSIKVRYATQKNTQTGEIVDFEIDCLKK